MSKIKVEQTHSDYIITIPSIDVWSDAFLMMTVKLLERYDPTDERAEHHRKMAELAGFPLTPPTAGSTTP